MTPHWKDIVPATKLDAVRKAFEGAFGTAEIDDIVALKGGLSPALVYKVTVDEKHYVMRLVMQVDALTDPHRQFVCLSAAANAGIAPLARYTNADDAVSIVDFIEHSPLTAQFTTDQELIGELATVIKSIHALSLFPPLVDFLDGVDSFIERYKSSPVLPEAVTEEYFRRYAAVQHAYPRHQNDLVSSHNDLNPGNVLQSGGKLWIIDWEASFANDRYVDLVIANIFFGSGERGEEILLGTYFGETLSDYHRARFFLMQQVCFMYYAMIFLALVSNSGQPADVSGPNMESIGLAQFYGRLRNGEISMASPEAHGLYARALMNESLSQMKSTRFQESLRLL